MTDDQLVSIIKDHSEKESSLILELMTGELGKLKTQLDEELIEVKVLKSTLIELITDIKTDIEKSVDDSIEEMVAFTTNDLKDTVNDPLLKQIEFIRKEVSAQKDKLSDLQHIVDTSERKLIDVSQKQNNDLIELKQTVDTQTENALNSTKRLDDMCVREESSVEEFLKLSNTVAALEDQTSIAQMQTVGALDEISQTQSETIKEAIDEQTQTIDLAASELKTITADKLEMIELKNKVYLQEELLRLNDHINGKLNTLKGEKGDCGEKGSQGESGLLRGISKWQDGTLAKSGDAFLFEGGLWAVNVSETKQTPSISTKDWSLLIDGFKSATLQEGVLTFLKSSGAIEKLGKVAITPRGSFFKGQSYQLLDLVTHNKASWISIADGNTNHPPSDNWMMVGGKGQKGEPGKTGQKGSDGKDATLNPEDLLPIINSAIEGNK